MPPEPLDLHCIGGFVIYSFYGLPRPTGDIDYYSAKPANLNLIEMAGEDSAQGTCRDVTASSCSMTVGLLFAPPTVVKSGMPERSS